MKPISLFVSPAYGCKKVLCYKPWPTLPVGSEQDDWPVSENNREPHQLDIYFISTFYQQTDGQTDIDTIMHLVDI